MNKKNEILDLDESDDFGFSFTDSSQLELKTATISREKLIGLRDMIMPLLKNLMKNPDKDTIVWPGRKERIEEFIKKMNDYIDT